MWMLSLSIDGSPPHPANANMDNIPANTIKFFFFTTNTSLFYLGNPVCNMSRFWCKIETEPYLLYQVFPSDYSMHLLMQKTKKLFVLNNYFSRNFSFFNHKTQRIRSLLASDSHSLLYILDYLCILVFSIGVCIFRTHCCRWSLIGYYSPNISWRSSSVIIFSINIIIVVVQV